MEVTKIEKEKEQKQKQEQWEVLIAQIKQIAQKTHGFGFRVKMYKKNGINRNRLSRFFKIKNPPRLDTIITMLDALGYEIVLNKKRK